MIHLKAFCGVCGAPLRVQATRLEKKDRDAHPDQARGAACTKYREADHPEWIDIEYRNPMDL